MPGFIRSLGMDVRLILKYHCQNMIAVSAV